MEIKLNDEILKVLKNNGFTLGDTFINNKDLSCYIEMQQYTPAGEDWWFTMPYDGTDEGFVNSFKASCNGFDIDEETEIFVNMRGENGVPSSIKTLLKDQEWKKNKLISTLNELLKIDIDKNNKQKLIFMDGEFTKLTTTGVNFLSLALITEDNKKLYLEIQQPVKEVDEWVKDNVVPYLNGTKVSEDKAKILIKEFLKENYGDTKPILVADVNQFDWNGICNLFGIWDIPFFYIPIDFSSILYAKGIYIDEDRFELAKRLEIDTSNYKQHNALHDTIILKQCWDKLMQ